MKESRLQEWIEATKDVVLVAIYRNLPAGLQDFREDVLQETYFRFYQKFKHHEPDMASASSWLYVVARNECRKQYRSFNRENRRILRLADWLKRDTKSGGMEIVDEETRFEREGIQQIIEDLPSSFAEVLRFRMEGWTIQQIGENLGVATGTVKSRLSRGRELLLRELSQKSRMENGGRSHEK